MMKTTKKEYAFGTCDLRQLTADRAKRIFPLKQDLVFQRARLTCGDNPDGRSSSDRAFVLTDATADTLFEIHVRQLNQLLFFIRPNHHLFVKVYGLWRGGAVFFTHNTGSIS
jgi:hypothetical protein